MRLFVPLPRQSYEKRVKCKRKTSFSFHFRVQDKFDECQCYEKFLNYENSYSQWSEFEPVRCPRARYLWFAVLRAVCPCCRPDIPMWNSNISKATSRVSLSTRCSRLALAATVSYLMPEPTHTPLLLCTTAFAR